MIFYRRYHSCISLGVLHGRIGLEISGLYIPIFGNKFTSLPPLIFGFGIRRIFQGYNFGLSFFWMYLRFDLYTN